MAQSEEDAPTVTALDAEVAARLHPAFAPGAVLAGRYRIRSFLARGGMGEVYEAEDLELAAAVALKTIRPSVARQDSQAVERFKHELSLARKVTHPNVARVFDLAHQPTADGETTTFITMELLAGRTLSERLREHGRMSVREALPVAEQIAEGLAAAHAAGIVHRDLKPGNIVLVDTPGGTRAVITDFGLAQGRASAVDAADGAVLGTPAYMSPEQVEGREAGTRSDIYSLGLVLYEMVTGHRPFGDDNSLSTAVARLSQAPVPPRVHVADLDPRWEQTILHCLHRAPEARFASPVEVARALRGDAVGRPRRWLRTAAIAAGASLSLAAALLLFTRSRPAPSSPLPLASPALVLPAPPAQARRSVAVLGFRNQTPAAGADWLATAFVEMLTTELATSGAVRTIAGESVARTRVDLGLTEVDALRPEELARVRSHLGSDVLVVGSYRARSERGRSLIQLDVRLQDATAGTVLRAFSETATEDELIELITRAGAKLRASLGVPEPPVAPRRTLAANPELARLYSQGLARLRLYEAPEARSLLEKAVAVAPEEPLVHAALAGAWAELGYDTRAREEARRAFELSGPLPEEERLWVEGRYREIAKEWDRAVEIYRRLWIRSPDEAEYGLRLAGGLSLGGRAREAFTVIDALRRFPAPARDDPRIDLMEAQASLWSSDYPRQQKAAASAAAKGRRLGARLIVARANLADLWASSRLGEGGRVQAAADEALAAFEAVGDLSGAAQVHNGLGNWHWQEGRLAEARREYERSLARARRVGAVAGQASAMNNLAVVLWEEGENLPRALSLFQGALGHYRSVAHRRGVAAGYNNTGLVLIDLARLEEAWPNLERALSVSREAGEKRGIAEALGNMAKVRHAQNRPADARRLYEESLALFRETGETRGAANVMLGLGRLLAAQPDAPGARAMLEEAAGTAERGKHHALAAEALAALGELSAEQGQMAPARELWSRAAEHVRAQRRSDIAARLTLATIEARLAWASGQTAEAEALLAMALPAASALQRLPLRLESGLVLGRMQAAAGHADAARLRLRAVEEEARRAGLAWIAERARSALAVAPPPRPAAPPAAARVPR